MLLCLPKIYFSVPVTIRIIVRGCELSPHPESFAEDEQEFNSLPIQLIYR